MLGEHHGGAVILPWLQEGGSVLGGPKGWLSLYSGGGRKTSKLGEWSEPKCGNGEVRGLGGNKEEFDYIEQGTVRERE